MSDKESTSSWIKTNLITILYAIIIALLIRTFLFQPFFIPSSSMEPGLIVGDRIFASKYDYGYSRHSFPFSLPLINGRVFESSPKRGDVVIFKPPHTRNDYIKRLIGLPGDKIKLIDGTIYINSIPVEREFVRTDDKDIAIYKETMSSGINYETRDLGNKPQDNIEEFIVPENHYFFMGDNRDNSNDSRFWGPVPTERIVAKAQIIFFSTKDGSWFIEFWRWPFDIQFKRIFKLIK
tara:strand:+ start:839 stop:1546 length:708 start_codon:yes stop_codon:yes gene_type:complete